VAKECGQRRVAGVGAAGLSAQVVTELWPLLLGRSVGLLGLLPGLLGLLQGLLDFECLLGCECLLGVHYFLNGGGIAIAAQLFAGINAFIQGVDIDNVLAIPFLVPLQDHPDVLA
jgi:hypothetical protein